jgi:hypothetical protein
MTIPTEPLDALEAYELWYAAEFGFDHVRHEAYPGSTGPPRLSGAETTNQVPF